MSRSASEQRFTFLRLLIISASLTAVAVVYLVPFTFTETFNETYQEQETRTYNRTLQRAVREDRGPGRSPNIMRNFGMSVDSGETSYRRLWIEPNGYRDLVWGTVIESYGYRINFYIFDQANYDAWMRNESSAPRVSLTGIEDARFEFPLDHPDFYYVVAENTFEYIRGARFSVIQSWEEETTAQVMVEKTRTVQNKTRMTLAERWFR